MPQKKRITDAFLRELSKEKIDVKMIAKGLSLHEELARFEYKILVAAVKFCHGSLDSAGILLNTPKTTVASKCLKYKIDHNAFK